MKKATSSLTTTGVLQLISIVIIFLGVACADMSQTVDDARPVEKLEPKVFQIGITSGLSRTPWTVAKRSSQLKKIEQRHGVRLEFVSFGNEADAVAAYAAEQIDGVTSTLNTLVGTLETGSRDTRVILLTDYSLHGLVSRQGTDLEDLVGQPIHVQLDTASHYFLFRILEHAGLEMIDVELVDSSALEILEGAVDGTIKTFAAGAPLLGQLSALPDFHQIMTSDMLVEEMVGGVAVAGPVISENPALGDALVEAWFGAAADLLTADNDFSQNGLAQISKFSGLSKAVVEEFLQPRALIANPNQSLELLEEDNLNVAIFGGQRFRTAADDEKCTKSDPRACLFVRDGNVIENGVGTRLYLDRQYLEKFIQDKVHVIQ